MCQWLIPGSLSAPARCFRAESHPCISPVTVPCYQCSFHSWGAPSLWSVPELQQQLFLFLMLHYTVQGHQPSLKAAISAACVLLSQVHPGFFLKAWSKSLIFLSPQIIMVEISLLQDGIFHQTLHGGIIIWLIIPLLLPAAFSCCF